MRLIHLKSVLSPWMLLCFFVVMSHQLVYAAPKSDLDPFWLPSDKASEVVIQHDAWQIFLDKYVVQSSDGINRVKYSQVTPSDQKSLASYLDGLSKIRIEQYAPEEQMAFWINFYNALTVQLILDNYPVKTITKVRKRFWSFGPWDDDIVMMKGRKLTLNDIEHRILRPIFQDNRIHYAVNCASLGCPNLSTTAFTRENLNLLLDQAARDFVNHSRGVSLEKGELKVSSIYHWYKEDFGSSDEKLIEHLQQYAKQDLKNQLNSFSGKVTHDYDWNLNEVK